MTSTNNTSYLGTLSMPEDDPQAKTMIEIDHVTMIFNIASEQLNSLKEYAIALSRRELHFKEFRALDDVSFEVKKGDVFGILGTNGSGKSTLLKIIAGVLEPSKGSCTVEGSIAPLIELGAGFDLELTARENIFLNGALLGYSKKFIQEHFEEIVEFAEVRDFLDMPMKNYSSGMVARIAFAIATVIVPDVLIVDEVLSVGDFMFQQKCEQRIQSLIKEHGVTVLIVSHNNDQIQRLCNKALWIEKGHLRTIGNAEEVCQLYRAIGGRSGKPESERKILDLLEAKLPADLGVEAVSVFGDDRYGTAVKANEFSEAPSDTVVIINSDLERESHIAASLAGLLDASLLNTKRDQLPDMTLQEIKHRSPSRVIIVGGEEAVSRFVVEQIEHELPEARVQRLADEGPVTGVCAFEYGARSSSWGSSAIVSDGSFAPSMLALSSLAFADKAPVFYLAGDTDDRALETLRTFDRLIVVEKGDALAAALSRRIPNCEIATFDSQLSESEHADEVLAWVDGSLGRQADTVVVTSPASEVDNRVVGPLVGRLNARLLFDNPQSLDSVSNAIAYLERHGSTVKRLVFVGNDMRFNSFDRNLLMKAIASNR